MQVEQLLLCVVNKPSSRKDLVKLEQARKNYDSGVATCLITGFLLPKLMIFFFYLLKLLPYCQILQFLCFRFLLSSHWIEIIVSIDIFIDSRIQENIH